VSPATYTFEDDGGIPNSRLPVLVYSGALERDADAGACEKLFAGHGWMGAWRDGIYPFHHFHSTAHEVLGIAAGSAAVMLGGPGGQRFELRCGDVVVLPAGTGHCNLGSSPDLLVVGAYPNGMDWDLCRGVTPIQRPVGRPPNAPRWHCARGTPYRRPRPSLKPPG
jgi:uncharacterized protein YjlB